MDVEDFMQTMETICILRGYGIKHFLVNGEREGYLLDLHVVDRKYAKIFNEPYDYLSIEVEFRYIERGTKSKIDIRLVDTYRTSFERFYKCNDKKIGMITLGDVQQNIRRTFHDFTDCYNFFFKLTNKLEKTAQKHYK